MSFTVAAEDPARQLADPGPPEDVTRQQRTRSWQAMLMRLYVFGVSLRATAA